MEKSSCYFNHWFEVFCNETSNPDPKPILKAINLEVLHISSSLGNVQVFGPLLHLGGCNNNKTVVRNSKVATFDSLKGSPFVFSQTMNSFAAVSCGNLALMHQDSVIVGGCMSICNNTTSNELFGTCNGIDCCRTALPDDLVTLNVTIEEFSGSGEIVDNGCKYAFVAAKDEFGLFKDTTRLDDMAQLAGVSMVLDWWLYNCSFADLGLKDMKCEQNSSFTPSSEAVMSKIRCSCKWPTQGNPYIEEGCEDVECTDVALGYSCRSKAEEHIKMIMIGVFTAVIGLFILLVGSWRLRKVVKKRKEIALKQKFFKRNGGLLLQQQLSSGKVNVDKIKMFNSKELEKATNNFSVNRILGQGGQGTVYKGMLVDGTIVAVKKASNVIEEGELDQFINEVIILSQINHRNIVNLMGCCLETELPLLIYEFIPNGTLFDYIHGQNEEFPLTWDKRLRISSEVAGALFYLHSAAALPIYHRDIKSTNILLDKKYRAKVADFGTSKSLSIDQTHVTTMVKGTFGYLDPEYFQSGQFTEKSDVYSFGVVLAELLTGQKPICSSRSEEGRSLATYFILKLEANLLLDIIDGQVMKEDNKEEIMAVAVLARRCLHLNGRSRPTMKEVTMELERIQNCRNCSDEQNHEEIEYAACDMVEPWDFTSTST
ncbi:hypothetical protein ACFE04_006620 [Oxalis oulophora]